jgi:hypothetical protein
VAKPSDHRFLHPITLSCVSVQYRNVTDNDMKRVLRHALSVAPTCTPVDS